MRTDTSAPTGSGPALCEFVPGPFQFRRQVVAVTAALTDCHSYHHRVLDSVTVAAAAAGRCSSWWLPAVKLVAAGCTSALYLFRVLNIVTVCIDVYLPVLYMYCM